MDNQAASRAAGAAWRGLARAFAKSSGVRIVKPPARAKRSRRKIAAAASAPPASAATNNDPGVPV
jgi:hypothetical protein